MDRLKGYEGKRVFVKLKSNREYSGIVLEVEKKESAFLITIKDKFGKRVSFRDDEISVIEEQRK